MNPGQNPVNTYALYAIAPQPDPVGLLTLIPYCASGGAAELLPDQSTLRLAAGYTYQISYSACANQALALEPTVNGIPQHRLLARPDPAVHADCPPCVAGSFLLPAPDAVALAFTLRPGHEAGLSAGTVSILRTPL